jgi:hypothetical protein
MRPLRRRTRFEKAVKAVRDAVPDLRPPKAVKSAAGAAAAVTAASAAISALRRQLEEGRGGHA